MILRLNFAQKMILARFSFCVMRRLKKHYSEK
jgi:hypothetical protein